MEFITSHLALVVLVVASGIMVLWPELQSLIGQQNQISPLTATQLINQKHALIVDCRKQQDFDQGHIPQSKRLDLDQLEPQINELKRFSSKPVIIVPAAGSAPAKAISAFKNGGFNDVLILKGGITAWIEASLPVNKSSS